jgi:hypothetical protein
MNYEEREKVRLENCVKREEFEEKNRGGYELIYPVVEDEEKS